MRSALTRREALLAAALVAGGCGASLGRRPAPDGSTLRGTYRDPEGSGTLAPAPGEPLRQRTELGPTARQTSILATLAHVTDAHVLDAESPARVTFLDRLGAPFESTFRPHETLTAQVLSGSLAAVRALRPDAVIEGGDLIDNSQANELRLALTVLGGGHTRPGSGGPGYFGVQSPFDADPFYYRPDLDAPRHAGLLQAAKTPFTSRGTAIGWHPVLGDHDILVAGEVTPTAQTRALALGSEAVWDLPRGLTVPGRLTALGGVGASGAEISPDGPPAPELVGRFLAQALAGAKVRVPSDPGRRQLNAAEAVARLKAAAGLGAGGLRLDYGVDVGPDVRLLVLDLARRAGGSGGLVDSAQPRWLAGELAAAGSRWVIVVSHQPLTTSQGGETILALLDRSPRVIAALSGHTHRNRIVARHTAAGGYWLISTASLIDFPQQARALRVVATAAGGVAIHTWMLDHVFPGRLGTISRALAYLDAQGGRPQGLAGTRWDRNVTLFRAPVGA